MRMEDKLIQLDKELALLKQHVECNDQLNNELRPKIQTIYKWGSIVGTISIAAVLSAGFAWYNLPAIAHTNLASIYQDDFTAPVYTYQTTNGFANALKASSKNAF